MEGMGDLLAGHDKLAAYWTKVQADPDVKKDILKGLSVFDRDDYKHAEGNSPAHIKASFMGANLLVLVKDRKPVLGTWQGIMFCEFDGPRRRKVIVERV